jgi:LCP family protein required for cell wall assembly
MSRINANLNGCGTRATGPEQLAIAVEDFTGLAVDHFVLFTFEGFRNVVNRVGGVEICTPVAVRDARVDPVPLDLPAGCTVANGDQTLAWVRSRRTEGLVDGAWVPVASSDLDRNQRQQEVILQAMQRLAGMRDVSELTALVEELADEFTIDHALTLGSAIATAWELRSIDVATIARPVIPVADFVTEDGARVLVPRASFSSVVVDAAPHMARFFS